MGKLLVLGLPGHYDRQLVIPDRGKNTSMGRVG